MVRVVGWGLNILFNLTWSMDLGGRLLGELISADVPVNATLTVQPQSRLVCFNPEDEWINDGLHIGGSARVQDDLTVTVQDVLQEIGRQ